MTNLQSSRRSAASRLLMVLPALGLFFSISAAILASLLVSPAQGIWTWAALFAAFMLALMAAAAWLLGRRLDNKAVAQGITDQTSSMHAETIAEVASTSTADPPHEHPEQHYQAIADTALDAVISADQLGNITSWNKGAERIFGYSFNEVIGRPLTFLMPERFREAHLAGVKRVVSKGEPHVIGKVVELAGLKKDGTEFPVELSLSAWEIPAGQFFTGIIRDITDRKRAEHRSATEHTVTRILAESLTLDKATPKILEAICERLGWEMSAYWSVDQQSNVLRCHATWFSPQVKLERFQAATKQTVFSPGVGLPGRVWIRGEPVWITDVIEDRNFPRAQVAAADILHGAFAFPIRRGTQVLGVMEFFSRKIQQPDEDLLQMFNAIGSQVGQFIERKMAEERLQDLKEYIERILDSVPNPIIIIGRDAGVHYINRAAHKAFALDQADVRGRVLFDLIQADDTTKEQLRETLQHYIADPHTQRPSSPATQAPRDPLSPLPGKATADSRKEIKIAGRTYQYVWFDVDARSSEDKVVGLVLRETTEESRLHDQLIETEKWAGMALLTSGIAHELNNPLYSVVGFSEAILDEEDIDTIKEHAKAVVDEARRMARIIRDLSGRTHLEAEGLKMEVDLQEQLDHALELARLNYPMDNITVLKDYRAASRIMGNPLELRQVFVNVITNAIQSMGAGGVLRLVTDTDQEGLQVKMEDTGPGIPPAHLLKVFDPFFTTKKPGEGPGLGLTIARRIIVKHGGHIRVESEEGHGTTVIITFPTQARATHE